MSNASTRLFYCVKQKNILSPLNKCVNSIINYSCCYQINITIIGTIECLLYQTLSIIIIIDIFYRFSIILIYFRFCFTIETKRRKPSADRFSAILLLLDQISVIFIKQNSSKLFLCRKISLYFEIHSNYLNKRTFFNKNIRRIII